MRSRASFALLAALAAAALLGARLFAQEDAGEDHRAAPVEIAGDVWHLGEVREAPGPVPPELEGWRELDCARCHVEIAAEWARTLHALAWVDPIYQEALSDLRRPEGCHACHAPEPLHVTGVGVRPQVRAEARRFGVDCASCHLGPDGVILGPWGAPTDAHPSARSDTFLAAGNSELCLSCHSTTIGPVIGLGREFEDTEQHARGKSCVACHMAPVERSAAIDPETGARSPVRPGRSHHLQSARDPFFLAQAFGLSAKVSGEQTIVVIENRAAHRVPGLEDRRFAFTFEALDESGAVLARKEGEIARGRFLPIDGRLEWGLAAAAHAVRVRAVHHSSALHAPVEFLDARVEVVGR